MISLQSFSAIAIILLWCVSRLLATDAEENFRTTICSNKYDSEQNCQLACSKLEDCLKPEYEDSTGSCHLTIGANADEINCIHYQQSLVQLIPTATLSVKCGLQAVKYQPAVRIIGGRPSKPHSWPWALSVVTYINDTINHYCGGSLIRVSDSVDETDILVTAAHCVSMLDPNDNKTVIPREDILVVAGAHIEDAVTNVTQDRRVTEMKIRTGYMHRRPFNDLAVLKLNYPIKFNQEIRPICLPEKDEPIPTEMVCYVAGWGSLDTHAKTYPEDIQELRIPVHRPETCAAGWGSEYNETSSICAGGIGRAATSGICSGDSGGMLACYESKSQPWILYGVTSYSDFDACLNENRPAIFTRVSTNIEFILESVNKMTSIKSS